ncbi:MAG: hypothetical protein AABN95_17725 [Acidobacteriota bacterium]
MGRCARTAASFWVFLTLIATDFLVGVDFRATVFRVMAFLGCGLLAAVVFLALALDETLLLGMDLAFTAFRAAGFCATALVAFGRFFVEAVERRLVAAFGEAR